MALEHINPPTLAEARGYSHIVKATGGTTIYVAGQGAYDVDGNLVGRDDHQAQFKQAFGNLVEALRAVGAGPKDVVKATFYVVGWNEGLVDDLVQGMTNALGGEFLLCASTLVGVERLAFDEMLVEVDAIAVID
jgi:enamine deaminase RidA (YjgF/YER057c/UK114 family)